MKEKNCRECFYGSQNGQCEYLGHCDRGEMFFNKTNKVELLEQELEKYKIAIKYFQDNGDQPTRDIIRNLLSY
jgi:hypothetical protein